MIEKSRPGSKFAEFHCNKAGPVWQCFSAKGSGAPGEDEIEFPLLRSRNRGSDSRNGEAQCTQNAQAALYSVGASGTWNGK
jgi:hypothetical protein